MPDINRDISIEQVDYNIDIEQANYTIEINPTSTFEIQLNEQGPQGARGYTGNGISSYELTSTVGLTDTYTITFTDGNTTTVDVTNGRGITSITGPVSDGLEDTYTINYNDNTTSTFTVTNGYSPTATIVKEDDTATITITDINGTTTATITDGTDGQDGTSSDITSVTASVDANIGTPSVDVTLGGTELARTIDFDFHNLKGEPGQDGTDGTDGQDGFSPIATVTQTASGATISITDKDGTTTADIINGIDGTDGADGFSPIATVTQTASGATISITDENGTTTADITNGIDGADGVDGQAATITVGSTTTGNPGTNASVINSGTSSAAILDFTIPKGDKGDTGNTGATGNGIASIAKTSTVGLVDTYTITYTNSNTDTFTITNGEKGDTGATGTAATIAVGTITTGSAGSSATVTNSGTSSAAVFDFTIPRGDTGAQGVSVTGVTLESTSGLQKTYRMSFSNNTYFDYIVTDGAAGATTWGGISGVLSNQTDLQNALDLKADISSLATVATSGSYNDLSNKPTIPTVNNATLTIQKNGTDVQTFTANASSNVTANITVPTDTSDLTNNAGYITGITSGDVTTALGYTPYNSSNPSGYISSASLSTLTDVDLTSLSDGQTIVYDNANSKWINATINSATWGNITGTLSNQTDLLNALNGKANNNAVVHLTGDEIINGDKTFNTNSTTYKGGTFYKYDGEDRGSIGGGFNSLSIAAKSNIVLALFGSNLSFNSSILVNSSGLIPYARINAITDSNAGGELKYWTGTKAQYDAIATKDANTLYNVVDDVTITYSMLELLYPIGSIYIGTMETCPMIVLMPDTIWELKSQDRVLQGAGTKGMVKTELPQNVKLPKMTGNFSKRRDNNANTITANGVFSYTNVGDSGSYFFGNNNTSNGHMVNFDSSRASSVYSGDGTDTEIQQPAYLVNIWERVA